MCGDSPYKAGTDRGAKKKSSVSKLEQPVILKIKGSKSILPGEQKKAAATTNNPQQANANATTDGVPVRKVKMPRTVSISQGIARGYDTLREDKPKYKKEVTTSVEVSGTDSFSVDAAFNVIKEFVKSHNISEARKPAFVTYKPEISDIHNITMIIENPIQGEVIKEYKGGLIKNLKQTLNNKNIDIKTRMVKTKEAKRLIVTDKQRYDYLAEKYPALDKLRQTFNLDLK